MANSNSRSIEIMFLEKQNDKDKAGLEGKLKGSIL